MYPKGSKCLVFGILCTFISFGQVRDYWIKLDPLGVFGYQGLRGLRECSRDPVKGPQHGAPKIIPLLRWETW